MANAAVSTFVQIGAVFLIAAFVWLIFGRKRQGLLTYLGLVRSPWAALALGLCLGLASAAVLLAFGEMRELAGGEGSVVAAARADTPIKTALALAILAIFKTAFAEELLFRGLLGKRLIAAFGFNWGNSIQAALFGAIHLALLFSPVATQGLVWIVVAFSAVTGWLGGWLNERRGQGSIMPGWMAHASANLASYFTVAFVL